MTNMFKSQGEIEEEREKDLDRHIARITAMIVIGFIVSLYLLIKLLNSF